MGTQAVTEGKLVIEAPGVKWHQVKMVRPGAGVRLAEPVISSVRLWRVQVPASAERGKASAGGGEVFDPGEDVDHRLRGKAGHRCAPDMADATDDPFSDLGL